MADWAAIGNQVAKVAPVLGGLLGGPLGAAAGQITATLLGTDPTPEAIQKKLADSPDALVRLKEAEMKHKASLEAMKIKEQMIYIDAEVAHRKIDTGDIQNARDRDKQLKIAGIHSFRADIMLTFAFGSLLTIIYMLWTDKTIPSEIIAIMNMAVGMILKMISDAFQFEFGSSRGSKEKDLLAPRRFNA